MTSIAYLVSTANGPNAVTKPQNLRSQCSYKTPKPKLCQIVLSNELHKSPSKTLKTFQPNETSQSLHLPLIIVSLTFSSWPVLKHVDPRMAIFCINGESICFPHGPFDYHLWQQCVEDWRVGKYQFQENRFFFYLIKSYFGSTQKSVWYILVVV